MQIMMCHGPRVLSFIVATAVVLTVTMVPVRVSSHCCRALTLHVWVCDSITKRIEKFHQDYIFFYHIWVLTGVHAARHWEEKRLYGEGGVAMRLWCHHNTRKWFCWCCRWHDRHPSSQPDAAVLWFYCSCSGLRAQGSLPLSLHRWWVFRLPMIDQT